MFRNALLTQFIIMAVLTLLLIIPLSMIQGVVMERSNYQTYAVHNISNSWTGSQTVVTPLLVIPYSRAYSESVWDKRKREYIDLKKQETGQHVFMAKTLSLTADIKTELRHRGIYSVPVYSGQFQVVGQFDPTELDEIKKDINGFSAWGEPRLILSVKDLRGIGADPALNVQGERVAFKPGTTLTSLGSGIHATSANIDLSRDIDFDLNFTLRGSQRLSFAPLAHNASIDVNSDWPHPNFTGRFLPTQREISEKGFSASWSVSSFSTGASDIVEACAANQCEQMHSLMLGVDLFETVDIYTRTDRATKYGILFVLLTFVAFFLTETLTKRRLHPIHYLLVGGALAMFFLLLISFAEHLGFSAAYGIATAACSLLVGIYLKAVLGDQRLAAIYAFAIAALYAMLFMILRSEDYALLMGSLLLFMVLALVMLSTRHTDWRKISEAMRTSRQPSESA
ncbi:MAG: cell envelope integrity protein CreD [Woeseiaceae bacterium]